MLLRPLQATDNAAIAAVTGFEKYLGLVEERPAAFVLVGVND